MNTGWKKSRVPGPADMVRVRIEVREVTVFARTVQMPRGRMVALQRELADPAFAEEAAQVMFEDLVEDREDDEFDEQQAVHARLWELGEGLPGSDPEDPTYPRLAVVFTPVPRPLVPANQLALDGLDPGAAGRGRRGARGWRMSMVIDARGAAMGRYKVTHIDAAGHRHCQVVTARNGAAAEDWMLQLYGEARRLMVIVLVRGRP